MVNINGENYKIRTREVNGQKQQVFYKDGNAYIKNANGSLELLRKSDDGIFKKASYETADYQYEQRTTQVQKLNEKASEGDLPPNIHYTSKLAIGKTGTFAKELGGSVTGKIIADAGNVEDSQIEPLLIEERTIRGNRQNATKTCTYAFNYGETNADTSVYPLEENTVLDDGTVISKVTYDWSAKPATKTEIKTINGEIQTKITYFKETYQRFMDAE